MGHKRRPAANPDNARNHINLRLERWHRWCVYGSCTALALTGMLWLAAHYFLRQAGEFGESIHPLEPWSMKLHGAAAMLMLFFLGTLLNGHIRRAVKTGRNRISGWSMIALLLALIATGYGLYYLAGESDHPVWSILHWALGLTLSVVVILHIVLGRQSRPGRHH